MPPPAPPGTRPTEVNPYGPEAIPGYLPNPGLQTRAIRLRREATKRGNETTNLIPGSRKYQAAVRRQKLQELRDKAVQSGLVEHGLSPVKVLQRLIDDAFIEYSMEQDRQNELHAEGKKTASAKLRSLRREAAYYASMALQYSISDRQTRIQEAQTQLVATLLQQTLRHPDINLSEAKIRKVPQIMEQAAENLQALAAEHTPAQEDKIQSIPPHRLR